MGFVRSISFSATVHNTEARFRVPKKVAKCFGLRDGVRVGIEVSDSTGETRFIGEIKTASGFEVYGSQIKECLKTGEPINVQIFRMSKAVQR